MTNEMEERRLPEGILKKAIRSGKEFGWRQADVIETIEAARTLRLGVIGGHVQYILPDGKCELYWLTYDPDHRREGENWIEYCNRTANETVDKFESLVTITDIEKEALSSFAFLRDQKAKGTDIEDKVFILDFDDLETDLWPGE